MNWQQWLWQWDYWDVLGLPDKLGRQAWEPTDEDRAAAWNFYTELRTRVTSPPPHYLAGDEQSALESIATLFKQARELIHQYGTKSRHLR